MPRFVLLYHDCPAGYVRPSHWDLMFEADKALDTWSLAQLPRTGEGAFAQTRLRFPDCPALAADESVVAERLARHRMAYLDFEGPLSGGRGSVFRVAAGDFTLAARSDDPWLIAIDEGPLRGEITLERMPVSGQLWTLTYRRRRRRAAGAIT